MHCCIWQYLKKNEIVEILLHKILRNVLLHLKVVVKTARTWILSRFKFFCNFRDICLVWCAHLIWKNNFYLLSLSSLREDVIGFKDKCSSICLSVFFVSFSKYNRLFVLFSEYNHFLLQLFLTKKDYVSIVNCFS